MFSALAPHMSVARLGRWPLICQQTPLKCQPTKLIPTAYPQAPGSNHPPCGVQPGTVWKTSLLVIRTNLSLRCPLMVNKKGAEAPPLSLFSMCAHQLRLHPRESAETQASATKPLSFSSSHATQTCSRHFLALVDSEPNISRKVSSFNGNGSLCEAK